jgi:large subunit ribosomal protein L5
MSKRNMNLQEKYKKQVVPEMMKKFSYKSSMAVPRIEQVVVNIGFGKEIASKGSDEQKKYMETISNDLALITGQKPSMTRAKKSISGFKLRQGMPMGFKVTLRKKRMFNFLEKLINIALPRSRDFKGLDRKSFDREGNLSIGVKEQVVFPEVSAEQLKNIFGFQITIKNTAQNKEQGIELLQLMGFPIKK